MADYNIYVHAIGTGNSSSYNPTVSWSSRGEDSPTTSKSGSVTAEGSNAVRAIIKASSYAQNPDSIVGTAYSEVAKAVPWVAAAVAVVKLGIKVIDNTLEVSVIESGDHRINNLWNDAKQGFANIVTPFSSGFNAFKTQRQWNAENKRQRAQRDLLGDSVINSYTNRGV